MHLFLCCIMLVLLFFFPYESSRAGADALKIWGLQVVPSLFPYMILCKTLSSQLQRSGYTGVSAAIILGMLGGSPSGATMISQLPVKQNERKMMSLCAFTGTISPMFFLSNVSAWMCDTRWGWLVLVSQAAGATASAIVIRCIPVSRFIKRKAIYSSIHSMQEENPIVSSIQSILSVGGCIVFFGALSGVCRAVLPLGDYASAIVHAFLEAAGGMHAIAHLDLSVRVRAVLLAAASGFSGLSILAQNQVFLSNLGIRMKHLLCFACLRAACAASAMQILLLFVGL